MIKVILMISVMFLTNCKCCDQKPDELLTVAIVFRHGDKMPKEEYFDVYPNNPWINPRLWNTTDLGTVTMKGKLNIYDRGKWLRERYSQFLPEKYSMKNIKIRSSDSDRVLMSAQLLLAGLYPPKGADVWNERLMWQPIPVHAVPDEDDMVVAQKAPCPKYSRLLNKVLSRPSHQYEEIKYLGAYVGKEINSMERAYKLYKLLKIIEENNFVMPNWAEKSMPLLKNKSDTLCSTFAMNQPMQRFKTGPIFHTILTHFDNFVNKSGSAPKMLLFAGHSRTLYNILTTLEAFEEQPPYTATLMFELKRNCNGNLQLDVYYQTTPYGPPLQLITKMPYETFKEKLKPILIDPREWKRECQLSIFDLVL